MAKARFGSRYQVVCAVKPLYKAVEGANCQFRRIFCFQQLPANLFSSADSASALFAHGKMCRDDDRKGFIEITATIGAIAWAAIALGVVCIPILLWTVPEGSASGHAPKPVSIREIWDESGSLVANRPFLRLLSAWFLNGLANGIPAALLFVYLEHGLGAGARHRPLFVLAYFLAAIVAIRLIVRGNDEQYSLHLRTPDNVRPWQFYRTQFNAGPDWKTLDIPFSVFTPYRLDAPLDITHLLRIGLIAIGRAFYADLAVSELGFYR